MKAATPSARAASRHVASCYSGWATAVAVARVGAPVVVNGRSEACVRGAIERLRGSVADGVIGGPAADLGTADGCAAVIAHVAEVDVLVNNMGIFGPKAFEAIS